MEIKLYCFSWRYTKIIPVILTLNQEQTSGLKPGKFSVSLRLEKRDPDDMAGVSLNEILTGHRFMMRLDKI